MLATRVVQKILPAEPISPKPGCLFLCQEFLSDHAERAKCKKYDPTIIITHTAATIVYRRHTVSPLARTAQRMPDSSRRPAGQKGNVNTRSQK